MRRLRQRPRRPPGRRERRRRSNDRPHHDRGREPFEVIRLVRDRIYAPLDRRARNHQFVPDVRLPRDKAPRRSGALAPIIVAPIIVALVHSAGHPVVSLGRYPIPLPLNAIRVGRLHVRNRRHAGKHAAVHQEPLHERWVHDDLVRRIPNLQRVPVPPRHFITCRRRIEQRKRIVRTTVQRDCRRRHVLVPPLLALLLPTLGLLARRLLQSHQRLLDHLILRPVQVAHLARYLDLDRQGGRARERPDDGHPFRLQPRHTGDRRDGPSRWFRRGRRDEMTPERMTDRLAGVSLYEQDIGDGDSPAHAEQAVHAGFENPFSGPSLWVSPFHTLARRLFVCTAVVSVIESRVGRL